MIEAAPIVAYVATPRTPEFIAQLHADEFELLPAAMARVAVPELREPLLMSCNALANTITRLKQAITTGEPDNATTQTAYLDYLLFRDAVTYWRDANAGNRWPNNPEAN